VLQREFAAEERVGEGRRGADRRIEGAGALAETRLQAGAAHLDALHAQPGDETRARREIMAELAEERGVGRVIGRLEAADVAGILVGVARRLVDAGVKCAERPAADPAIARLAVEAQFLVTTQRRRVWSLKPM
jgi:hypothetical protein